MVILVFDIGGPYIKYGVWNQKVLVDTAKTNTPKDWKTMKRKFYRLKILNQKIS